MSYTNPLSNQSYLNKDFQTIYPELLDLIKKLTYKWDPTVSNESDPGVLLIKLNALIADKNNYNIDKNILECFPDTVTQSENAYKLFNQLGYNMHWYKAATGEASFMWESEKLTSNNIILPVTLPQFSMICDDDKQTVYTILNELQVNTNGKTATTEVIQGIITDYTLGSDPLIRISALDSKNRLYFPISNVAENGIFISDCNRDLTTGEYKFIWAQEQDDVRHWSKVDNLLIEPLNKKCYQFGIDQVTKSCYIEFPSDISNLIGEGILIKYIQTNGVSGNISAKRLTSFYSDVVIKLGEQNRTISNDIKVNNTDSISNGEDPETIDEAYVGYKRLVGTFDTLVTLRDYLNYIVNDDFKLVSNGIVSDRKTDIQSSYQVVTTKENTTTIKPILVNRASTELYEKDGNNYKAVMVPEMTAYDLRTYFLEYSKISPRANNLTIEDQKALWEKEYKKSFQINLGDSNDLGTKQIVKDYYDDAKSVQHNFIPKLARKPLFFKNKYSLNLTIIPNSLITNAQAEDIEKNVYEALYKNLLSSKINFGEELTYETVYDICNNADSRIKAVALDNINYDTYAVVYYDSVPAEGATALDKEGNEVSLKQGLNEIYISTEVIDGRNNKNNSIALEIAAKNILAGNSPLYEEDKSFKFELGQSNINIVRDVEKADTYAEIEFNNIHHVGNGWTNPVKILKDESVFLYAPNLIEDITYASSIKYLYYTTEEYTGNYVNELPPNRDLILDRGQYLFFFWKDEDSKDAPYNYIRYSEGTILKSTVKLTVSEDDQDHTIRSQLMSYGYEGEGQILGALNDKLYNIGDTILSASKTVTIKRLNKAELNDKQNDCYWITNKKELNEITNIEEYVITFECSENLEERYISDSYQTGEIYVSNTTLAQTGSNDSTDSTAYRRYADYTLKEGEEIIILRPKKYKVSYNAWDENIANIRSVDYNCVDYVIIGKLVGGTVLNCNGDILECAAVFDAVNEYINNNPNFKEIKWGSMEDDLNHIGAKTPEPNDLSDLIAKNTSNYILTGGYRINVIGTSEPKDLISYEYQLKNNEYFIYTNDERNELHMPSTGTCIQLTLPRSECKKDESEEVIDHITFKVPVISDEGVKKISEDGMKAFSDDIWYSFNPTGIDDDDGKIIKQTGGKLVTVIENQLINLGEGTEIRLKQVGETVLVSENGGFKSATVYDPAYNNLRISSEGVSTKSSIDGSTYKLQSNALSKYDVQYKNEDETDWTDLPSVMDSSIGWDGYMILNINSSSSTPQKLEKNHKHKITLYKENYTDDLEVSSGSDVLYFQTNYGINLTGGNDIDLSATNIYGEKHFIDFYYYSGNVDSIKGDYILKNSEGNAVVDSETGEPVIAANVSIIDDGIHVSLNEVQGYAESFTHILELPMMQINSEFTLPNMILPIEFSTDYDNIESFDLTIIEDTGDNEGGSGGNKQPIGYDKGLAVNGKILGKVYYYKIEEPGDILSIKIISQNPTIDFILRPIFSYKYSYSSDTNSKLPVEDRCLLDKELLENTIIDLDVNREFDYTYQPLIDNKIQNPLRPKYFLNKNHFCNRYTIPQISSINIKTMNKRN